MRQAIEIRKLPLCEAPGTTWLGRMWARFFRSSDRKTIIPLQHCSAHFLRDIGLLDDRRANRLLRDESLFRR
jgi:hypothetical protein